MPDESKESKAKKFAAARKKLKEYQQRGSAGSINVSHAYAESSNNSGQVSSNISERSESQLQLNGNVSDIVPVESSAVEVETETIEVKETEKVNFVIKDYLSEERHTRTNTSSPPLNKSEEDIHMHGLHNINAIQVLITEKAQLTAELNKFKTVCRERDLDMEELRIQLGNSSKRVEDLSQRLIDMQKQQEQQRLHKAELQHKLSQARAQLEEHSAHIIELKQQLSLSDDRLKQLQIGFKEKTNDLELAQLRIRQLSDETNITKDNRLETLTQTQFMYEQQIRDLQAMVQQLTKDKEQANVQYRTYVQQLNAQVQHLTERNNELTEETAKLQEREKQCVEHIQQLEREIQNNLLKQKEVKEEYKVSSTLNQHKELQERLNDIEAERYEFQLKIKSQEDRLCSLQNELMQKETELQRLKEHLENVTSEQPDKTKLLATMESDKVAASLALSQNVDLKKQLDELELRFVQLTNDKADLMNRLDAEQYANREMHVNYANMEERLKTIDERFKFKDDEMIRLSHENEELKKLLETNQKHLNTEINDSNDVDYYRNFHEHHNNHNHHYEYQYEAYSNNHRNHHNAQTESEKEVQEHNNENGSEEKALIKSQKQNDSDDPEACLEATEEFTTLPNECATPLTSKAGYLAKVSSKTMPHIATEEAVEKLQNRFTQLITQCADLTEEKQRLEHLVMQLQSETETIGEYIALYQTQRRILKQREYEKAAQTAMLQAEREKIRERLNILNNLVNSLGMELPQSQEKLKQKVHATLTEKNAINSTQQQQQAAVDETPILSTNIQNLKQVVDDKTFAKDLSSSESQQILYKIQNIITEIKENTKELPTIYTVDHLKCCSGKFEVV